MQVSIVVGVIATNTNQKGLVKFFFVYLFLFLLRIILDKIRSEILSIFSSTFLHVCLYEVNYLQLQLTVENLPSLVTGDYQCAFTGGGVTRSTNASVLDPQNQRQSDDTTKIDCMTPMPNLIPPIPTGKGMLRACSVAPYVISSYM